MTKGEESQLIEAINTAIAPFTGVQLIVVDGEVINRSPLGGYEFFLKYKQSDGRIVYGCIIIDKLFNIASVVYEARRAAIELSKIPINKANIESDNEFGPVTP